MRDHWQAFLDYLKANQDWIEPIIYTSALKPYNDNLMKIIDPKREIFKTHLY
jgi:TFIIF-interacting CTD phosphatase-like protein